MHLNIFVTLCVVDYYTTQIVGFPYILILTSSILYSRPGLSFLYIITHSVLYYCQSSCPIRKFKKLSIKKINYSPLLLKTVSHCSKTVLMSFSQIETWCFCWKNGVIQFANDCTESIFLSFKLFCRQQNEKISSSQVRGIRWLLVGCTFQLLFQSF